MDNNEMRDLIERLRYSNDGIGLMEIKLLEDIRELILSVQSITKSLRQQGQGEEDK